MLLDYVERPSYAQPLAIVCIAAGILLCIEGYRIHRIGAFISALFIIGDYVLSIISLGDEEYASDIGQYYATFFAAGAIVGVLALIHARASSVVTGFCAGLVVMDVVLSMARYHGTLGLLVALLSVSGVVGAGAAAVAKKPGIVVATSVVGADVLITGVRYITFAAIYKNSRSRRVSEDLNSAWWTLCAIEIVLAVLAIPLQLLLTARNVDYEHNDNDDSSRDSDGRETVAPYQHHHNHHQQQRDTQHSAYRNSQQPAQYNAQSYSRESQPPGSFASSRSSGAPFVASTDRRYDQQHPYSSVQTPQQRQQDGKSSYVTGSTNAISHV